MRRSVSTDEISKHAQVDDIWIVVNGMVYDVTQFAPGHPGGPEVIYQYAGGDASTKYNSTHSPCLIKDIEEHLIGDLDTATVSTEWSKGDETPRAPDTTKGDQKPPLEDIISLDDFEQVAMNTLSPKSWAYNSGAANDNISRDANRTFLQRIWFRPAIMRDVSRVTTRSSLFGYDLDIPVYISPLGAGKTICEEGELPLARGAASSGVIQCVSTVASYSFSEIMDETPMQAFYQVYVNKDRSKTEALVKQAEASAKIRALFITADLPVMSKREDDERIKPEGYSVMKATHGKKSAGIAKSNSSFIDSSLNWNDMAWLRSITKLPILLKGVQRAEDAVIAMKVGFDGIVVSNHGGRAADTAPPAILILLEIHRHCPQVLGKLKVLVDGGFRRGSDVVKAICLGASAVGLGRSFGYALNYGQEGVEHAVNLLKEEIETAMQLVGMTDLMRDAGPTYLNTSGVDHLLPAYHSSSYIHITPRSTKL
ncbi:FMN-dependent dehydrogenase-domain-containing protein [Penicillium atrosanguineum]|uniref:L-lactate dehydrogenase (cytochrome) n=1 Tax=Penicillium atrosanguineum TaxID=1132637 RepID=A0A9W9Q3D8_9EURO|nr:FMN-dependent dehydrogenase-domain-containing protein [Penicillium atrosanguineum]